MRPNESIMNNLNDSLTGNPYFDYVGEEIISDSASPIDHDWNAEIEACLPTESLEPNTLDCKGCSRQFEADLDPEAEYCPSCSSILEKIQ